MATNTLGYYNPEFYANEALLLLQNSLGMASRVHLGYDAERRTFNKGQYINIKRPSTFAAQSAPQAASNITTESVQINLNSWQEVRFEATDQELAYSGEEMLRDHIAPAVYALSNKIDQDLNALYTYIPWHVAGATAMDIADISAAKKQLFTNGVNIEDASSMHFEVGAINQSSLEQIPAFAQYTGAGAVGVDTQKTGNLGYRYGFNFFANQNTSAHTSGACDDAAGTVTGNTAVGATSITIGALTDTQTVKAGDTFSIAGDTQQYAFTEDGTVASNSLTAIGISPPLKTAATNGAVVTIALTGTTTETCLAFHKNFAALAFAKLPDEMPRRLGAECVSVQDPKTGISVRYRMYYDGTNSKCAVVLDVLYGVKVLDPNMACRVAVTS